MKQVEIYTTPICGYCAMAKRLLSRKGVAFTEYNVMMNPSMRGEMIQRALGGRSVPQIFIDGAHVGGCDELHGLERAGRLDGLLAA